MTGGRLPDEALLKALWTASQGGREFVDADSVRHYLSHRSPDDVRAITTQGLGQRLSRLASQGRCQRRWDYYMWRYASSEAVDFRHTI